MGFCSSDVLGETALSILSFHGRIVFGMLLISSPLKRSLALRQRTRRHRWQTRAFPRSILTAAPSSTEVHSLGTERCVSDRQQPRPGAPGEPGQQEETALQ